MSNVGSASGGNSAPSSSSTGAAPTSAGLGEGVLDGNNPSSQEAEGLRKMSKLVNSYLARGDCGPFREPVDWRGLELYDYPKVIKKMMDLGTVKRKLERGQYRTVAECAEDIRLIWSNCKLYNADGSDFYLLADAFSKRFEERYRKICKSTEETSTSVSPTAAASSAASSEGGTASASANLEKPAAGSLHRSASAAAASSASTPATPSLTNLEAKVQLVSDLFRLRGDHLGQVLQLVELRCPQALEHPPPLPTCMEDENDVDAPPIRLSQMEINMDAIDARTLAEMDRFVQNHLATPSSTTTTTTTTTTTKTTKTHTKRTSATPATISSDASLAELEALPPPSGNSGKRRRRTN